MLLFENLNDALNEFKDNTAVADEKREITYHQLSYLSDVFAFNLMESKIHKNQIIPLCFGRSIETIIAIVGILKAGGCYMPIEFDLPTKRKKYLIANSSAQLVVINSKEDNSWLPNGIDVIDIHDIINKTLPVEKIRYTIPSENDPFFITYTSGSTGNPKGVVNTYLGVSNNISHQIDTCNITSQDIFLQQSSLSFDASAREIFCTLLSGGCLVVPRQGGQRNPEYLCELMLEKKVTLIQVVPSMLRALQACPLFACCNSLRLISTGGEVLDKQLINQHFTMFDIPILNIYGPTECAINVTDYLVTAPLEGDAPIGNPIRNVELLVLDENQHLVEIGKEGELWIGGVCLAQGYLGNPQATDSSFMKLPSFGDKRFYRTGDLVRQNQQGEYIFVSRLDNQVKIRGVRIELGEIESAALTIQGLNSAAAVFTCTEPSNKRITLFYDTIDGIILDDNMIRVALGKVLPPEVIPSYIKYIPTLPKLSNDKIDRQKLLELASNIVFEKSTQLIQIMPRTQEEKTIHNIWCYVLEQCEISVDISFVSVGGDSIKSFLVYNELKKQGYNILFEDFYKAKTIENQAKLITKIAHYSLIEKTEKTQYKTSRNQKNLLFIHHINENSTAYNLPIDFVINGMFDIERFEQAIIQLVARHPILTAKFKYTEGKFYQSQSSDTLVNVLKCHSVHELNAQRIRPFDLFNELPIRVALYKVNSEEWKISIVMHHIISDGWSHNLFIEQLSELYNQYTIISDNDRNIDYFSYAEWENMQSDEEHTAWWLKKLSDAPVLLELPTDYARPSEFSFKGSHQWLRIPQSTYQNLYSLAREEGCSPYVGLLASYAVLLAKYTGQRDIVVATPAANRVRPEILQTLGFFATTLPIRIEFNDGITLRELMRQIQNTLDEALLHQSFDIAKVVELLGIERQLGYNPLYQTLFVLQQDESPLKFNGLRTQRQRYSTQASKVDIQFSLFTESDTDDLVLEIEYATDLFSLATIERFAQHWLNILVNSPKHANDPVLKCDILSSTEKMYILEDLNRNKYDYGSKSILSCIYDTMQLHPKHIALEYENIQLTYEELRKNVAALVYELTQKGVQKGDFVGIYMNRSPEMVVSLLAVMFCGAVYIPIDPNYPTDRIDYMLSDSDPRMVLTQCYMPIPQNTNVPFLIIELEQMSQTGNIELQLPEINGDSPAYMIYTSGSTGKPKGVINIHKAIFNRLAWMQKKYQLTQYDVILQKTPFSFDVSVWEFFWPLMYGATLAVAKPETHKDPQALLDVILQKKVTIIHFVPSMLTLFLEYNDGSQRTTLRQVFCSGEALPGHVVTAFHSHYPNVSLHNLYGPTEAAVDVSYWPCNQMHKNGKVLIGKPIDNIQLYILDEFMNPVPIGVKGELYISGVGLAKGYHNKPELTAKAFVTNPFHPELSPMMYRTGDIARYDMNGDIEYLGRADNQVKIRGLRVELGEIESHLDKVPEIHESLVGVHKFSSGQNQLVAWYTGKNISETLPSILSACLPEFMVPSLYIHIDTFPLSPNGKKDRKALPNPDSYLLRENVSPPITENEKALSIIWAEILNVNNVSRDADFFRLGGDSIISLKLLTRLKKEGYDLSLKDIFLCRKLSEMAARLEKCKNILTSLYVPFQFVSQDDKEKLPTCYDDAWPASLLQTGMLYHADINEHTYHDVFYFEFAFDKYDKSAFMRAVTQLSIRHPVIKSSFDLASFTVPMQLVNSEAILPVDYYYDGESTECTLEKIFSQWMESEKQIPFDASFGQLLRIKAIQNNTTLMVGMSFHHIILDGWSVATMLTELINFYQQEILSPGSIQEKRLLTQPIVRQQEIDATNDRDTQYFWEKYLQNYQITEIPSLSGDREREYIWQSQTRIWPASLVDAMHQLVAHHGISMKTITLAAHLKTISMVTNTHDVTTGLTMNVRPSLYEAEAAVGLFLNTVPMRVNTSQPSWLELCHAVHEAERQIQGYHLMPLVVIHKTLEQDTLFDCNFNYVDFHIYDELNKVSNISLKKAKYFEQTNFDYLVNIINNHFTGDVELTLNYNGSRFTTEQINRYIDYYFNILAKMVNDINGEIIQTELLSCQDCYELVPPIKVSNREQEYCVKEKFEDSVTAWPNNLAITCGDKHLTYRELNNRANGIAHHLINVLDVKPGHRIGAFCARNLEGIICLLAIVKTGATYVPIDPAYPKERIDYIIQDSSLKLVLTVDNILSLDFQNLLDISTIVEDRSDNPEIKIRSDAPLYIIYTSGSTGNPKGVQVSNFNVLRLFANTQHWFNFSENDVWTLFHSLSFDFSVWEMWGSLLFGGELVVVTSEEAYDITQMVDLVTNRQVTRLNMTPSAFEIFKNECLSREYPPEFSLKSIIFGGEALNIPGLLPWFIQYGEQHPKIINMYGITETTVHVTYREIKQQDCFNKYSLIGEPIPDLSVSLLNDELQPVPIGTPGEIFVSGAGVSLGYFQRDELNQQRFVMLKSNGISCRAYRSGDIARRLPSGDIEYLGREDAQVKINGYRIEISEVEAALSRVEDIVQSAVLVFKRESGNKALVGYYRLKQTNLVDSETIRQRLQLQLPIHMIPSFLIEMESFDITVNGKLNRKSLPNPLNVVVHQESVDLPENKMQEVLLKLIEDELGLSNISINKSYFSLGGDSLHAIRIVAKLKQFGYILKVSDIFRQQTIKKMAECIKTSFVNEDTVLVPFALLTEEQKEQIQPEVVDAYPATLLQQGMIYHSEIDVRQAVFHDLLCYEINKPYDSEKFRQALKILIAEHDVLRTAFDLNNYDQIMQVVFGYVSLPLTEIDISALSRIEKDIFIDNWFEQEKQTGFNWSIAPIGRFFVILCSEQSFNLAFSFNHCILDGWSLANLMTQLLNLYSNLMDGKTEDILPNNVASLNFRDFVAHELLSRDNRQDADFWRSYLKNYRYNILPRSTSELRSRWSECALHYTHEETEALKVQALGHNVSLNQLLLACHCLALHIITGDSDITTGVFSNMRLEREGGDKTIGLHLNILPLRIQLDAYGAVHDFVRLLSTNYSKILSHRNYPYANIQHDIKAKRLTETAFNFTNFRVYENSLQERQMIGRIRWFEHADFALLVNAGIDILSGNINIVFNANGKVLDPERLEIIRSVYQQIIQAVMAAQEINYQILYEKMSALRIGSICTYDDYDRTSMTQCLGEVGIKYRLRNLWLSETGYAPEKNKLDSLTILRLSVRIENEFGLKIPLHIMFHTDAFRLVLEHLNNAVLLSD